MIYLRGDVEPIRAVRPHAAEPGVVEVWFQSDGPNEAPIITQLARLVADGGLAEIEAAMEGGAE